jgi:hypothetical protein
MTQGTEPRARVMTTPKAAKSPVLPAVQMAVLPKAKREVGLFKWLNTNMKHHMTE